MRVIFGRQLRVESDGWAGLASLNKLDPTAASQTYPSASRAAHGEHMLLQRMRDTRLMQDTLCGTLSRPDPGHSVARSISPTQSRVPTASPGLYRLDRAHPENKDRTLFQAVACEMS